MVRRKRGRMAAVLLAAMMTASALLAGCGGEDAADTPGSTQDGTPDTAAEESRADGGADEGGDASTEKTKLTMVTYLGNPSRDALIQELVADLNIELEIISPPADQAQSFPQSKMLF